MENYSHTKISELRQTLEYAEALILLGQQRELDRHRSTIKQQLTALNRLSKGAVDVARNDMLPKQF
jgi:hypothetical protein